MVARLTIDYTSSSDERSSALQDDHSVRAFRSKPCLCGIEVRCVVPPPQEKIRSKQVPSLPTMWRPSSQARVSLQEVLRISTLSPRRKPTIIAGSIQRGGIRLLGASDLVLLEI
jgi:hypothetical protein